MRKVRDWAELIRRSTERAFYGKADVVEKLLIALLCRGHVLIEDVPGVGKTIAARAIGQGLLDRGLGPERPAWRRLPARIKKRWHRNQAEAGS